jgi:glutamine amidotransferase
MTATGVRKPLAPTIAVIDYGLGNRRSVEKALVHVGARAAITADSGELDAADGLVLCGVGAFRRGMDELETRGLSELIRERVAAGVPLLGICLGMQLLFESSDELGGETAGLGLLPGAVRKLDAHGLRLPHIGWNEVTFTRPSPLLSGLPAGGAPFYHVHSYVARPRDEADVIATAEYGSRFTTGVEHGNVYGVQFHPEKSSLDGLRLLRNFCALCVGKAVTA